MFKKILVCSDGSELAHDAARAAAEVAAKSDAEVILLHVLDFQDWPPSLPATYEESLRPETRTLPGELMPETVAQQTGDILREAGVRYQTQQEFGHPAEKIVAVAEREQVNLIVMGSRGLGPWKALLLGSVSEGVLHYAHCSVLVVREDPPAGR